MKYHICMRSICIEPVYILEIEKKDMYLISCINK